MPGFPSFADRLNLIGGSVFEKFLPKMREQGDRLVRLHLGDSYIPPNYELGLQDEFVDQFPYFNRYCNTMGIESLRRALAGKSVADNDLLADESMVMLTSGASHALNVAMMSLLNPGDQVIVLTPAWPFFRGMVKIAGGTPVEVPLYMELYDNPELDIEAHLKPHINERTVALYLNSPNNPSGKVLNRNQLNQIAAVVTKHNLWLISDEAYDGMTYDDHKHISVGSIKSVREQTLSIFTFSKVYMFAGIRLGYIVAGADILKKMNRMLVHQLYSPNAVGQYMLLKAVESRKAWQGDFIRHCEAVRDTCDAALQAAHRLPEGAYYFFFPVTEFLGRRDYPEFIGQCLEAGVSIAPGNDFGKHFGEYIRVCFAAESPERVALAIRRLNGVINA